MDVNTVNASMPTAEIHMSREAGRPGCRATAHAARHIEARGSARSGGCFCFDSGSRLHANTTLVTHSAAATSPGAARPQCAAEEPIAGPTITPAEVAAESQPRARAR